MVKGYHAHVEQEGIKVVRIRRPVVQRGHDVARVLVHAQGPVARPTPEGGDAPVHHVLVIVGTYDPVEWHPGRPSGVPRRRRMEVQLVRQRGTWIVRNRVLHRLQKDTPNGAGHEQNRRGGARQIGPCAPQPRREDPRHLTQNVLRTPPPSPHVPRTFGTHSHSRREWTVF